MATSHPQQPDLTAVRVRMRRYYRQLVHQLLPHMIVPYLVQNKVLDISEADLVLAERGLLPQSSRILALVERKGPRELENFLKSLRDSNHGHLADVLELPDEAEHTDNEEVPMSVDTQDEMPSAWSGDSSVIDIRISMLPGLHGQLANVQPIITTVSPSPSTTGQPPSFPTSHGCCPSPGCPCGHMQQFLLHTLFAAQQTLAGLYPLSSEQDAQMSAECRGTIRECRKTLQWLAEGGVHVHQVLQACVLLRATCKDVEALDRLLKWLKDGTLQWKLKRAYKVSGDPQSTSSFLVKINPNQYLLCRENIDLSSKGFNAFRSQYPQAFLHRMGDDIDSQYYLQLVQCLIAKDVQIREAQSLRERWQKSFEEAMVVINDLGVKVPSPEESHRENVSAAVLKAFGWVQAVASLAAEASSSGLHGPGSAGVSAGAHQLSREKLDIIAQTLYDYVKLTDMLLDKLHVYRCTTYVSAKLTRAFMGKDFSLKKFDIFNSRLAQCYPKPCSETVAMEQYVKRLSGDYVFKKKLLQEYLPPLKLQPYIDVVSKSSHDLRDTVESAMKVREMEEEHFQMLPHGLHRIKEAMQILVGECGLESAAADYKQEK